MSKIAEEIGEATSLVELHTISKELKEKGYNVSEVNMEVSKRKRELLSHQATQTKLKKVILPPRPEKKYLNSCLNVQARNNQSNTITITESGNFVW